MYGYESWVALNGILIPSTSADSAVERNIIESSGLFGGTKTGSKVPLASPHLYDWPNVTASFSCDASTEVLEQIKHMILNRDTPISLVIHSGYSGTQTIEQAWWNNISINASEDALISVTVSLIGLERQEFVTNDFGDYLQNILGTSTENFCYDPIPFYLSKIQEFTYVKNWTFTLAQDVVRFMGCQNSATVKNPFILGVGTMTADMKFSTFDEQSSDIWAMPDKYSGVELNTRTPLTLDIDNETFLTMTGEINQVRDPLQGTSSISDISYEYNVYSFA